MPTPPTTFNAPVVGEIAAVLLVIVVAGTVNVRLLVLYERLLLAPNSV
jgi:hypothetical protein